MRTIHSDGGPYPYVLEDEDIPPGGAFVEDLWGRPLRTPSGWRVGELPEVRDAHQLVVAARNLGVTPQEYYIKRESGMRWCWVGKHWVHTAQHHQGNRRCVQCDKAYRANLDVRKRTTK